MIIVRLVKSLEKDSPVLIVVLEQKIVLNVLMTNANQENTNQTVLIALNQLMNKKLKMIRTILIVVVTQMNVGVNHQISLLIQHTNIAIQDNLLVKDTLVLINVMEHQGALLVNTIIVVIIKINAREVTAISDVIVLGAA